MSGPRPPTWIVSEDEARAFELQPGLWRLRLPLSWPHVTHANAYAIDALGGGIVLVDCGGGGHPGAWRALTRALAVAGRRVTDVRHLVLTHAHSDHIGFAARVADESRCTVWMNRSIAHMTDMVLRPHAVARARRRCARREGVPDDLLAPFGDLREYTEGVLWPMRIDRELAPGTSVASALGSWEVLAAPGHSPSQVGLFQRERGLLISADLFSASFFAAFDYGYSPDPVLEWRRSLESAMRLPVEIALPGHGRPIANVGEAIAGHLAGLRDGADEVERALAGGPATCFELSRTSFAVEEKACIEVTDFTTTLTFLLRLVLEGRVERRLEADGVHRYAALAREVLAR